MQSCSIDLYSALIFVNLHSALLSLLFFFFNTDFFLFILSSFFYFFLSLSFFSSAALPAFHYCHLFSQPLNP